MIKIKMRRSININIILNTIICCVALAKTVAKDGEIEVKLQFLEYELEDFCVAKNEAEWKFLNGSEPDLTKLLDVETKESDFYKRELEVLQKHVGKKFSRERLQRLMDLFSHPGAPLLGSVEFREYKDYSRRLQEMIGTTRIECSESEEGAANESQSTSNSEAKCSPVDIKKINKLLYEEKNEGKLKHWWRRWFRTLEEKNKKTKYDFVQQLSILDLEAEQNGEEELNEYWLKQADLNSINYESVHKIWKEVLPLYEKLKLYMRSLIVQNYGKNVLRNQKIIPVHVLGSLESHDWITAAEKLGGFDGSEDYKSMKHFLKQKTMEDLCKMADHQTGELKLGFLPQSFYDKSSFSQSSQMCQNKIMDYCEKENLRAMFCAGEAPDIKSYIKINEDVMKMKYLLLSGKEEEENGYLFREGPRDSALHEAMQGLSSLRALWPQYWEDKELLTNHSQKQTKMLSLLITALHVVPPLPYYLASDTWRINALKQIDAAVGENMETTTLSTFSSTPYSGKREAISETGEGSNGTSVEGGNAEESHIKNGAELDPEKIYDTQNLTREWWSYREQFQGVGSPDGDFYEDYLQDTKIIWNKSYLSKFLGKILQFQILEKTKNLTENLPKIQHMLQKGKSRTWQLLIKEMLNITEISVKPLLNYFKPLEEFLEKRIKLKNQTDLFGADDLNFVSQSFSLDPKSNEIEGEKPAEGSDALFFSLAAIAAVGIVAVIVTVGRRRYKRKQRTRERKRRLAEL